MDFDGDKKLLTEYEAVDCYGDSRLEQYSAESSRYRCTVTE